MGIGTSTGCLFHVSVFLASFAFLWLGLGVGRLRITVRAGEGLRGVEGFDGWIKPGGNMACRRGMWLFDNMAGTRCCLFLGRDMTDCSTDPIGG